MPKGNLAIVASAVLCLLGTTAFETGPSLAQSGVFASTSTTSTVQVFRRGLDAPGDMVLSGNRLVVANVYGGFDGDGSIAELSITTGRVVKTISGASYRFNGPNALALWGDELFVANTGTAAPASVTELNVLTGELVRVISGRSYGFEGPVALVLYGQNLFVVNTGTYDIPGSVTELDASTGSVVRVISGPEYRFATPDGIVLGGGDLFVSDSNDGKGGWVTEVNASTGKLVKLIAGPAYHFTGPGPGVMDGPDLFVLNRSGSSLTELNAPTGKLVRVISGPAYRSDTLTALTVSRGELYLAGGLDTLGPGHCFVKEVDASTGSLVKSISGLGYDFFDPEAILTDGGDVLVLDSGSNAVTRFPSPR